MYTQIVQVVPIKYVNESQYEHLPWKEIYIKLDKHNK